MNTDGPDKTDKTDQKQGPQKHRGWFRRNWRRFVLLLFVIIVVGGGALYWNFFLRVYNLQVCREAMKTIAADKGMQETLGRPIKNAYWPSQETMPRPGSRTTRLTSAGASSARRSRWPGRI